MVRGTVPDLWASEHLALVIGLRRPRKILHRHRLVAIYQVHRFMTKYELLRCNFLEPQRFRETNLLSAKMLSARCLAKAADRNSDPGSDTAKILQINVKCKAALESVSHVPVCGKHVVSGGRRSIGSGSCSLGQIDIRGCIPFSYSCHARYHTGSSLRRRSELPDFAQPATAATRISRSPDCSWMANYSVYSSGTSEFAVRIGRRWEWRDGSQIDPHHHGADWMQRSCGR